MRRPAIGREFVLVLMWALVIVLYCGTVAADPRVRSMPAQAAPGTVRQIGAGTRDDHASKPNRPPSNTADQDHDRSEQSAPAITPEQAAQRARDRFGGRVLNVILEHERGGPYYRVKLLEQGRVRVVDIDARR